MEEHDTGDWGVSSQGTARVFGYENHRMGEAHDLYELQWEQRFEAEERPRIIGETYLQYCAVIGVPCEFCDAPAVGYMRIPECGCVPGGCRIWQCADCTY